MSLEAGIAELNTNILALIASNGVIAQNQERLIAGQAAAIAKVEEPKATRSRKPKADDASVEGNGEPAGTASGAAGATTASEQPKSTVQAVSEDDLRTLATTYLNGDAEGEVSVDERKRRGTFLQELTGHFGHQKLLGPDKGDGKGAGISDPTKIKQAHFYISRKKAGHPVQLGADYDFDGAHDQTVEAAASDDFGID